METRQVGVYRAKRKDSGEWVEGYYAKAKDWLSGENVHVIFPLNLELYPNSEFSSYEEIIPETLGRLLEHPCYDSDYADTRFFQGDIIAVWRNRHADIEHEKPDATALVLDEHSISENGLGRWFPQDTTRVRIIGNAYDNPELLDWRDLQYVIDSVRDIMDDYLEHRQRLIDTYDIHGAQAGCYICNFENEYFCHQYNGGCSRLAICKHIHDLENENSR